MHNSPGGGPLESVKARNLPSGDQARSERCSFSADQSRLGERSASATDAMNRAGGSALGTQNARCARSREMRQMVGKSGPSRVTTVGASVAGNIFADWNRSFM